MTSLASGKEGLFPFLNLPKELRDMVYDELTEFELYGVSFERSGSWRGDTEFYRNKCRNFNHEGIRANDRLSCMKLSRLTPNVRLINQQIKHEAEIQFAKAICVSILNTSRDTVLPTQLIHSLPRHTLSTITSLEYKVLIQDQRYPPSGFGGYNFSAVKRLANWVRPNIASLEGLREVNLIIYLMWAEKNYDVAYPKGPRDPNRPGLKSGLNRLTDIPFLKTVKVIEVKDYQTKLGDCHDLWVQWDTQHGWHAPEATNADQS